jgi:hypothetical protein
VYVLDTNVCQIFNFEHKCFWWYNVLNTIFNSHSATVNELCQVVLSNNDRVNNHIGFA